MTGHGTTFVYVGSFFGPAEGIRVYRWDGAAVLVELSPPMIESGAEWLAAYAGRYR